MAKTTFTFICGHTGTSQGRNRAEADWRAKRSASENCWDCETAARTAQATQAADDAGLPALTGTPKQIAYGVVCRDGHIGRLHKAIDDMRHALPKTAWSDAAQREIMDALSLLLSEWTEQTQAKAWIEAPNEWASWLKRQIRERSLCPLAQAESAAATVAR